MAKVISLFSTKGGVGKTLIAVNIGVSLVKSLQKKVLLVDFDLHGGSDMSHMLNASAKHSLSDFVNILRRDPAAAGKEKLITKTVWGVDFLPAILSPHQLNQLRKIPVDKAIDTFLSLYDYIVIDSGSSFSDTLIQLFNKSSLILYVVTPDILSIYQTKWSLDTLDRLKFPSLMIKIVLNRADSASSLRIDRIEDILPVEFIAKIPSEGKISMLSINKQVPLIVNNPRSRLAVAFNKLAEVLVKKEEMFVKPVEMAQLRQLSIEGEEKTDQDFWERIAFVDESKAEDEKEEKTDEILLLKQRIHSRLIETLDLRRMDIKVFSSPERIKALKEKAQSIVVNLLAQEAKSFISSSEVRQKFAKEIIDEALGLGPLEDLLKDSEVTEIMVNNKNEIYVERHGRIELTNKRFISNEQVRVVIERIIAPLGRHIDEAVPMVDARLPDGSRVNAIIHPLSLTGPTLTIRKFRKTVFSLNDLVRLNTLTSEIGMFLRACVLLRKNIIVSGGTGSGKTTTLNVLSSFIPDNERIITIEDAAELRLNQRHWVRLEARPPNIEGKGEITVRDLFRNTLRMRPDRIIIGECRGKEALDMLQAMNTGHDGSMTTVHANSTHDVFVRLDSMILMSGIELPIRAIREMITSAINIIVHTKRLSDGRRKVVQVTEVKGMLDDAHPSLEDIFYFKQEGVDKDGNVLGRFLPTGYIPSFWEEVKIKGIDLPQEIFTSSS